MTIVDFSVFPVGAGESLSDAVADVYKIVKGSGLDHEIHDMGTIIEGTSEECLGVVRQSVDMLARNYPRVYATVKLDYRTGDKKRIGTKAKEVREKS
ncbi:MAG: MTH1187 family thiamine-binding protein [Candidatus Kapaibacterium sp.]